MADVRRFSGGQEGLERILEAIHHLHAFLQALTTQLDRLAEELKK